MDPDATAKPEGTSTSDLDGPLYKQDNGPLVDRESLFRQIAEQKLLIQQLQDNLDHYRQVTDNAVEGIAVAQDGYFRWVNPRCSQLFELPTEDLTSQPFSNWLHPEDLDLVMNRHQKRLMGENPPSLYSYRIVTASGRTRWLQLTVERIRWLDRPATLCFMTDITELRHNEENLRQSQYQLAQAQKMEAMGNLASGLTHDFNNDLGVIRSNVELALDFLDPDHPARRPLNLAIGATERSAALVQRLFTFARRTEADLKPVHPEPIVSEAVKILQASLPAQVKLEVNMEKALETMLSEPAQLQQIIINLGLNAIQAMEDRSGTLAIALEKVMVSQSLPTHCHWCGQASPGLYWRLMISDTGPGMEEAVLTRIFEPFFTTRSKGQGTGLGLAVVHGLVVAHKGAMVVESHPGSGTRFYIYFPLAIKMESRPPKQPTLPRPAKIRTLLVDDDLSLLVATGKMLERLGVEVTTATTGREAWEMFQADPDFFDLLLTDQVMPEMTGLELAKLIRRVNQVIPIVLTTGFSGSISLAQNQALGIWEVLDKPVSFSQLRQMIGRIFNLEKVDFGTSPDHR